MMSYFFIMYKSYHEQQCQSVQSVTMNQDTLPSHNMTSLYFST